MIPEIEANSFLTVCIGLWAVMLLASAAVKFWRLFFPSKDSGEQPVSRAEFDARMSESQERSDEFRTKISDDVGALREEVSRLGEAVRAQNKNFIASVESMRRTTEHNQRSLEERLNSIEGHLRK